MHLKDAIPSSRMLARKREMRSDRWPATLPAV